MKSYSIRVALLSALLALFVGASVPSWASGRPVKNGPIMTDKEATTLIATASTAKEHLKLAKHFNQEADQFEADAKGHEEMIEAYRRSPNPRAEKTPGGVGTIEHCAFLSKSDLEMARVLRDMGAAHEQMAVEAGKK